MKFDKLGWVVAAGLAAGWVAVGFQTPTAKFGTVDIVKVFNECDLSKKNDDQLQNAQKVRRNIIQFIGQNKAMLPADAEKYATLAAKATIAAADKTEMDRITQDAVAVTSKQRELATKASPTPDDVKQMQDFSGRSQTNSQFQQSLVQRYEDELREMSANLRDAALGKVRDAVRDVANKQGYTLVFSQEAAPFAANDLTAEALKSINVKK